MASLCSVTSPLYGVGFQERSTEKEGEEGDLEGDAGRGASEGSCVAFYDLAVRQHHLHHVLFTRSTSVVKDRK